MKNEISEISVPVRTMRTFCFSNENGRDIWDGLLTKVAGNLLNEEGVKEVRS